MSHTYLSNAQIRQQKLELTAFITTLHHYGTQNTQEAEDESNDLTFQWLENHLKNKNFQIINHLLKQLTPNHQLHASTIIAILMGTGRAAREKHLPSRETFINNIIHPEIAQIDLHKYRITP